MAPAKKKRPRDPNLLAKSIVDEATGECEEEPEESPRTQRSKKAGKIGGPARAKKLTPAERSEIARIAAQARWKKNQD